MTETQTSITAWADATFGVPVSNLSIAQRADKELRELIAKLEADDAHPEAAAEVADVFIVLYRLVDKLGAGLFEEIDRKMAINRARTWAVDGNGHGQHVDPQVEPNLPVTRLYDEHGRALKYVSGRRT